jgi:hypothetical protein
MEEKDLKQELQTIEGQVKTIVVKDAETFKVAGNMILMIDAYEKKVHNFCDDNISKADKLHKSLIASRGELLNPAETYRKILKKGTSVYLTEQERIRREAQAKLDAERRKQEEVERKRLEERAAKAEEKGKVEKAEELREKAAEVYIPPAIVQPEVEKTTYMDAGTISQKKDIEVEVIDSFALIKAVASGAVPPTIIKIDEGALKKYIKAAGLKQVPGCQIHEVIGASFRGNKVA